MSHVPVPKRRMIRLLHQRHAPSDDFIAQRGVRRHGCRELTGRRRFEVDLSAAGAHRDDGCRCFPVFPPLVESFLGATLGAA
jgi:hypothetical protein